MMFPFAVRPAAAAYPQLPRGNIGHAPTTCCIPARTAMHLSCSTAEPVSLLEGKGERFLTGNSCHHLAWWRVPLAPQHHTQDHHGGCRQPYPPEFTAYDLRPSPGEEAPHADWRDLNRPPWKEIPHVAERREQGDAATAIGEHIEQGMREGGG